MRNRRRNWMLKRIALAFAVAAVAAPAAQAVPLEPGATKSDQSLEFKPVPTGAVENQVKAGDYGMPRAMPTDYTAAGVDRLRALDGIEQVRLTPRETLGRSFDGIEQIRLEPRGVGDSVVSASPSSFDWGDAGIGAGLAFAAILLAAAAAVSVRQYGRLGQV